MPDEISNPDTDATKDDEAVSSQLVQSAPADDEAVSSQLVQSAPEEETAAADDTIQGERSSGGYVSKGG